MAIWVIKDGQREGPYEEEDVRELVYEGTYGDADPAIQDGQYDWTTVGKILGHPMPAFESPLFAVGEPAPAEEPPPIATAPAPEPPPVPIPPPEPVAPAGPAKPMPVTVVDFQMPFGSMVLFMVKWVVAAIPALLILGMIATIFWIGCVALLALLLHH